MNCPHRKLSEIPEKTFAGSTGSPTIASYSFALEHFFPPGRRVGKSAKRSVSHSASPLKAKKLSLLERHRPGLTGKLFENPWNDVENSSEDLVDVELNHCIIMPETVRAACKNLFRRWSRASFTIDFFSLSEWLMIEIN